MKRIRLILLFASIIVLFSKENGLAQSKLAILTRDGCWSWFSDPRAIYLPLDSGYVVTGYVTEDGSVASLLFNLKNGQVQQSILNNQLEVDDHNNPAFIERPDGKILAFYTKHHNQNLYMNTMEVKKGALTPSVIDTINPNGIADLERFGDNKYTDANPFILSGENNRIYLFGRWVGFKPNITWSDDGGKTWADSKVIVAKKPFKLEKRPYVKYYSDGKDKIHMVFTDGHPANEKRNSVYYAYYSKGAFYRANGEMICTIDQLPFQPKDATLVYDAKKTKQRAWIFDMVADSLGNPAIAYVRYPSTDQHIYHYTWFDGKVWNDREVANSGKWFPKTPAGQKKREPYYSGGMAIDPNHRHTLFISMERNNVFEMEKWVLNTEKDKWEASSITRFGTRHQVRPFVVKNFPPEKGTLLLWNAVERYTHYTDYKTAIKIMLIE